MHLEALFSVPISLFYSVRCCGLRRGLRLPVRISCKARVRGLNRKTIQGVSGKINGFSFGLGGSEAVPENVRSTLIIQPGSKLIVGNDVSFGAGSVIRIENKAVFRCGDHVGINKNCEIYCSKEISIGNNCIFGWNVAIRDSDGHRIFIGPDRNIIEDRKPVSIGEHVWIAAHVDILKGTKISDGSVVGYRSCVLGVFEDKNILLGGYPAKIIKKDIYWEK